MIHIHNGDVVAALARRVGIPGEHLAYRESLVTGPVVPGEEWIETRAQTLAAASGVDLLRARTDVVEQEQVLDRARDEDEIVLWFEHDLYCLVHLLYLLQRFAGSPLSLVWSPEPLGNEEDHSLIAMFESRAAVSPEMRATAARVWEAYTGSDAEALNEWVGRETVDFPFLGQGMALHASRFPSTSNGIGAVEQRALDHIAAGFNDFGAIFEHINAEIPRFGFGDSEVFRQLRAMSTRAVPLITINGEPPKALCMITAAGEDVLRGRADDIALNGADLWLGGVHLTKENLFRWDGQRLNRSAG